MKRVAAGIALLLVAALCPQSIHTQEREDRTLLTWGEMRSIINEASGERAMHHVLELVPYPRVRELSEYESKFRESLVMERFAREYGFSNVEVETFPGGSIWHASQAELWMTQPELRKLYDIYDVVVSVCSGSESGDVTADVVDVGIGGRPEDYAGKDVKGRIVLGSAPAGILQRLAVFEREAAGVLSSNQIHPETSPDQILSQGIASSGPQGKQPGFGWSIAPRVAREITRQLGEGNKVTLRSVITSQRFPGRMEVVHAEIPGDGSSQQEIAISAHLYEGYIKQGANDDNSGCAATLEMGRAYLKLVQEAKLPRPRRTVHFLWVPEISGTVAWLRKHEDVRKQLTADLNFDMEGLGLRLGYSQWIMHRTPDTFPTYLNDVGASVLEFVGNTNRERVRYRNKGYNFTLPVVAPNGSWDPFYYVIDKHYGASDHVIYLNEGIPSLMFITWPDPYYHSSQDTPDKLDSTQFKRAAVVGTACMSVLASAGDQMAARVTAEALSRGTARMGEAERKGLGYIADAPDAGSLADAYKEARTAILHQARIEKGVVRSAAVLYDNPAESEKQLATFDALIDQRAAALVNEAKAAYLLGAGQMKTPAVEPAMTESEQLAARTVVERAGSQGGAGGTGGFRGGQGMDRFPPEERAALQAARAKVPSHMLAELNVLLGRRMTVLEIRDFLSGEFEPLALTDLMTYLKAQEKMGSVRLTEKPEEMKAVVPAPRQAKPRKKN